MSVCQLCRCGIDEGSTSSFLRKTVTLTTDQFLSDFTPETGISKLQCKPSLVHGLFLYGPNLKWL